MRVALRILCAVCAVWTAGCASMPVDTEIVPAADVARFSTFAMAPPAAADASDGLDARIRDEIAQQLGARGYLVAPPDYADLSVDFRWSTAASDRRVNAGDPDTDYYVPATALATELAIDIAEGRAGKRLWRGVGRARVQPTGRLITTSVEEAAVASVRAVLAELPPAKASR